MSSIKKLASQTAIYGLSSIVGRLLNYLLVPLYTNLFVPEQYGVVTELYAYVAFFAVLMTYGMETAFFRFSQRDDVDNDKVYATSLISILISTTIFIFVAVASQNNIAKVLHYQNHVWYITCFIFVIAIDAITAIPFARLRQQNRPIRFVAVRLINIFINIGLNIFFIVLCPIWYAKNPALVSAFYNPSVGVGYIFIANLLASIVTVILLIPQFNIKFNFDKTLWKELFIYGLPLLFAGLAGMVNETADRVMLKYLLPTGTNVMAETGIYGACYKISIIMTIFIQTFRYAAEPFFFNHSKNKNAQQLYADVMKYFVIVCGLIFLVTLLYMDIVKFFVGKKYWEGLYIVPVLLFANWCLGIYYNLTIWYKLTNKTKYGAWLSAYGAAVTILFNFILIPKIGYYGAAWATLICYSSMMVISFVQGQKYYHINYDVKRILMYMVLALIFYGLSTLWSTQNINLKFSMNTLLLFIYAGVAFYFERKEINNLRVG